MVANFKQEYINKINLDIAQVTQVIQSIKKAENNERLSYERNLDMEQKRVVNVRQEYFNKINISIAQVNQSIRYLLTAERDERLTYEKAIADEQIRVDMLRQKNKQLQLQEQQRLQLLKQQRIDNINLQIVHINQSIQSIQQAEKEERTSYEKAILIEQERLDKLHQQVKQLEFEQQRRDIARQSLEQQILNHKISLEKLSQTIISMPKIVGEGRILSNIEIDQIHELINKLSAIKVICLPKISSQHIKSCLDYQAITAKHQD